MSTNAQILRFPTERRHVRQLVDLPGLIEQYGYSERWWRYRISEGLPARRWGQRLRFDPAEVEQWLEERYGAA